VLCDVKSVIRQPEISESSGFKGMPLHDSAFEQVHRAGMYNFLMFLFFDQKLHPTTIPHWITISTVDTACNITLRQILFLGE
jgi:hypothetical protein